MHKQRTKHAIKHTRSRQHNAANTELPPHSTPHTGASSAASSQRKLMQEPEFTGAGAVPEDTPESEWETGFAWHLSSESPVL